MDKKNYFCRMYIKGILIGDIKEAMIDQKYLINQTKRVLNIDAIQPDQPKLYYKFDGTTEFNIRIDGKSLINEAHLLIELLGGKNWEVCHNDDRFWAVWNGDGEKLSDSKLLRIFFLSIDVDEFK